jgi:Uma2 family endonuclease
VSEKGQLVKDLLRKSFTHFAFSTRPHASGTRVAVCFRRNREEGDPWRRERLAERQTLSGAFRGAPDLAVEIVSPGNSAADLQRKIEDWLTHGAEIVLAAYPETRSVVLWRPGGAITLRGDAEITLDPVLPGFRCKISEVFLPRLRAREPEPVT